MVQGGAFVQSGNYTEVKESLVPNLVLSTLRSVRVSTLLFVPRTDAEDSCVQPPLQHLRDPDQTRTTHMQLAFVVYARNESEILCGAICYGFQHGCYKSIHTVDYRVPYIKNNESSTYLDSTASSSDFRVDGAQHPIIKAQCAIVQPQIYEVNTI